MVFHLDYMWIIRDIHDIKLIAIPSFAKRREWMGCWGLLGWLLVIMDHSQKFPGFSTSKKSDGFGFPATSVYTGVFNTFIHWLVSSAWIMIILNKG